MRINRAVRCSIMRSNIGIKSISPNHCSSVVLASRCASKLRCLTLLRQDGCLGVFNGATTSRMDDTCPYLFAPDDESLFPDVSCLGIDSVGDSDTVTLLPMAADPCSAEQFSFDFAELGRNSSLDIDLRDRVEALRGLFLDRTRKVSRKYEATVVELCRLCEQRHLRVRANHGQRWTMEDSKSYVRQFAQQQNVGVVLTTDEKGYQEPRDPLDVVKGVDTAGGLMLSEKTLYSAAVENFKALMDSTELTGFAEQCMIELLMEDVVLSLKKRGFGDVGDVRAFGGRGTSLPNKTIPVPG